MNSIKKLRVAIIGLGAVTQNIHVPAYKKLADKITVVGGCDIDDAARKTAVAKFGIEEVFDNPSKMISATAPDIVSVCTPPSFHVDQTLLALENKCHVFCEKPAAESLADAVRVARFSKQLDRLVVINNQFPYMNIHRAAKKAIDSSEFGRLLFLEASQVFRPTKATESGWRGQLQKRVCFEFGIHIFELIRYFFAEEPLWISAQMPSLQSEKKNDSLNLITLEFPDGRAASIILNRLSKAPEHYLNMRLDGEFASIRTSIGGKVSFQVGVHTREKRPFFDFDFIKGGSAILETGIKSKIIAKDGINPFASSTAYHFDNFINAVQKGEPALATIQDNIKTLALVFAAYDSAQSRRSINMPEYMNQFS